MLPGGDVRGFCAALGIDLPAAAGRDVSVRCFADPDAHAHGDRHASCSVSLVSGAWRCWACDARGGAYDAALARGVSPREAVDLLIAHGLAERRHGGGGRFRAAGRSPSLDARAHDARNAAEAKLAISEADLAQASERLAACQWPLSAMRAEQQRLWSRAVVVDQ